MDQKTSILTRPLALFQRARVWLNKPRFGAGKPKVGQRTPAPIEDTPPPSTPLETEAAMEPAPETEVAAIPVSQTTQKAPAVHAEENPDPLGDPPAEDDPPAVVAARPVAAPRAQVESSESSSEAGPGDVEAASPAEEVIIGLNESASSSRVNDEANALQTAPPETIEPQIGPLQDAIQEVMQHATEINTAVHKALFLVNTTKAQADAWLKKAGQDLEETQRTKQQAIECLDEAKAAKREAQQWLEQARMARAQALGCLEEARATKIAALDRQTLLNTEALRPVSSATTGSEQPNPPPPPADPRPEPQAQDPGGPGPATNDVADQAASPEPPVSPRASSEAIGDLRQGLAPHQLQADAEGDPAPVPAIDLFTPPPAPGGQSPSPQAQKPDQGMLIITQEELDAVEKARVETKNLEAASAKAAREAEKLHQAESLAAGGAGGPERAEAVNQLARDEAERILRQAGDAKKQVDEDRRKVQQELQRAQEARAEAEKLQQAASLAANEAGGGERTEAANRLARDEAERILRQAGDAKKQAEEDRRKVQQELQRAQEARAEAEKLQQAASLAANEADGAERTEAANRLARDDTERILRQATDAKNQADEDRRKAQQELEQARAVRLMASRVHQRQASGNPSELAPATGKPASENGADDPNASDIRSGAGVEFHIATEEDLLAQLKAHQERQRQDPSGHAAQ